MLAVYHLGEFDPMLGLHPNLRLGVDYRVTASGVAIALTTPILAMFREIQAATNQVANLFGMPFAIAVDGKIGSATGKAFKATAARLPSDLRRNIRNEALAGNPATIAKDARNVLGTLKAAIEARAPFRAPTPTLVAKTAPIPTAQPRVVAKTAPAPLAPVRVGPAAVRFVTTAPLERRRLSTPVFVAVLGAFVAAGIGAAVLVGRRA